MNDCNNKPFGLLGRKLGHSFSPEIHREISRAAGQPYDYVLFEKEPEELEEFLRSDDWAGLNVTVPYKEEVIKYLDHLSGEAADIGAVNTIVRQEGKLVGYNTDYFGFMQMLDSAGVCVEGRKCLVLGDGGASKAVQQALKDMGAINGKTDSDFAPADYVTREEFIKMFVSLFGEVDSDASADFADVDSSAWYYSYVASALKAGIVNGVGDGRFGVGQNISRQDIAVIAFRALAIAKGENEVSFDDFDSIADYAKDAVDALSSQGIINGMGDGSFAPNANATRAQAAKILYELYKLKEGEV